MVFVYSVSRLSLLVSFVTHSVSEISKPAGSSQEEGEPEMGSVDAFRITVDEERQAVALAQELTGFSDVDLQRDRDRWVVSLRARHSANVVVRVLDAVRRSLAGDPTASALVTLDAASTTCQAHAYQ
jgi:hypothetical protein